MSEPVGVPPPQAIRRSDGSFHVLNVDMDSLSAVQRFAVGVQIWPQVRTMLEAAGEYRERQGNPSRPSVAPIGHTKDIDVYVAQAVGLAFSTFATARPGLQRNEAVFQKALAGEYENPSEMLRAAGYQLKQTFVEGRTSGSKHKDAFFGHGDKLLYALEPLLVYGRAWKKRGYQYPHVNPKEASRRLKRIDEAIAHLTAIRADLEPRSHVATLRVRSEHKRRK